MLRLRLRACQLSDTPRVQVWASVVGVQVVQLSAAPESGVCGGGDLRFRVRLGVRVRGKVKVRVRITLPGHLLKPHPTHFAFVA